MLWRGKEISKLDYDTLKKVSYTLKFMSEKRSSAINHTKAKKTNFRKLKINLNKSSNEHFNQLLTEVHNELGNRKIS